MPITDLTTVIPENQIDQLIARDTEVSAGYLPKNPTVIEWGWGDFNILDFHVSPSPPTLDFDARIIASGGTGQNGKCNLSLQAAFFSVIANFGINGGASIVRLLMAQTYIDLPSIAAGGIYDIYMSIPGALPGDIAFFLPTVELYNGLWTIHIQAAITANNVARVYFRNAYNTAVDIAPFSGKLLVIGFA